MTTSKDGWWRKRELTLAQTTSDNVERNNTRQTLAHPSKWWEVLKLNFKTHRKISPAPGVWKSLRAVVFASWLNVLLVFIPISWGCHFAFFGHSTSKTAVIEFVTSFIAIIPLAKLMGFATEELSLRTGETIGGLLNATLGNAVELIVAIIAMLQCQLGVVQSSLVGSILSNLLLVLGMCFFAGGTRFSEQGFAAAASQLNSSLLVVSVIAVLLPAAFHFAIAGASTDQGVQPAALDPDEGSDILKLSRGVSIILLVTYGAYLAFQLWSHAHLYADDAPDNFKSTQYASRNNTTEQLSASGKAEGKSSATNQQTTLRSIRSGNAGDGEHSPIDGASPTTLTASGAMNGDIEKQKEPESSENEAEQPQLSVWMSVLTLTVVTVLVAVTAEILVGSIEPLTEGGGINKEWVGLILLPIVGNAAEHVTAVTVSVKDKLTLSLGVAAGSSIQIALFVIPFMVTLAWIVGKPLTLLFDTFESITLFLAVTTVNYVTADGKTNWLEGLILMNLYVIIGVMFWFYPGTDLNASNVLPKCV